MKEDMQNRSSDMMVSVIVRAFNVEPWISQALDSILSQKTSYPFEIIIGEDGCSDQTLAICKSYASRYNCIILLESKKNLGLVAQWIKCLRHSTGKYIMICDGDDFWHNPNKLQMQVDYMEAHPECILLHTDYNLIHDRTGRIEKNYLTSHRVKPREGHVQKDIYQGKVSIANVTSCYRRAEFGRYVPTEKYMELGLLGDDYPTWVILSGYGEVRYLPVSTATYRVGQPSITREVKYDKIRHRYEMDKRQARWLCEMFPSLGVYDDDAYYDAFTSHQLVLAAYRNNDYASARKFAKRDKFADWKTYMAYTWISFQITRLYIKYKR